MWQNLPFKHHHNCYPNVESHSQLSDENILFPHFCTEISQHNFHVENDRKPVLIPNTNCRFNHLIACTLKKWYYTLEIAELYMASSIRKILYHRQTMVLKLLQQYLIVQTKRTDFILSVRSSTGWQTSDSNQPFLNQYLTL